MIEDLSVSIFNGSISNTQIEAWNYYQEVNINEERSVFPLIRQKSNIYKNTDVFIIESFRPFESLSEILRDWLIEFGESSSEQKFMEKEQEYIDKMGFVVIQRGFLVVYSSEKTCCKLDVSIYGNIIRLSTLDDYKVLSSTLSILFQTIVEFSSAKPDRDSKREKYKQQISYFKKDEACHSDIDSKLSWIDFANNNSISNQTLALDLSKENHPKNILYEEMKKIQSFEILFDKDLNSINNKFLEGYLHTKVDNKNLIEMNKNQIQKYDKLLDDKQWQEIVKEKDFEIQKIQKEYDQKLEEQYKEKIEILESFTQIIATKDEKILELDNALEELKKNQEIFEIDKNWFEIKSVILEKEFDCIQNIAKQKTLEIEDLCRKYNSKDSLDKNWQFQINSDKDLIEELDLASIKNLRTRKELIEYTNKAIKGFDEIHSKIINQKKQELYVLNKEIKDKLQMVEIANKKVEGKNQMIEQILIIVKRLKEINTTLSQEQLQQQKEDHHEYELFEVHKEVQGHQKILEKLILEQEKLTEDQKSQEWKLKIKNMIISDINHKDMSADDPIISVLNTMDFNIKFYDSIGTSLYVLYSIKGWLDKSFDLNYIGCTFDESKECYGIFEHSNGKIFYEGLFSDNEIWSNEVLLYYDNENPLLKYITLNGIEAPIWNSHGIQTLYYKNGMKYFEGNFVNGKKNGEGIEWYINGTVKYKGNFLEGEYHSDRAVIFNSFGDGNILIGPTKVFGGKLEGSGPIYYSYENNIQIWDKDVEFISGKPHNNCKPYWFNPYGNLRLSANYENGLKNNVVGIRNIVTDVIQIQWEFENNVPIRDNVNGTEKFSVKNSDGSLAFEGTIKECKTGWHGMCTLYHYKDGHTTYKGNYKAPNLFSIIFGTFDLELEDYNFFQPVF